MLSKITLILLITCLVGPAINVLVFASSIVHFIDWETAYEINTPIIKWACVIGGLAFLSLMIETAISGIKLYKIEHED